MTTNFWRICEVAATSQIGRKMTNNFWRICDVADQSKRTNNFDESATSLRRRRLVKKITNNDYEYATSLRRNFDKCTTKLRRTILLLRPPVTSYGLQRICDVEATKTRWIYDVVATLQIHRVPTGKCFCIAIYWPHNNHDASWQNTAHVNVSVANFTMLRLFHRVI